LKKGTDRLVFAEHLLESVGLAGLYFGPCLETVLADKLVHFLTVCPSFTQLHKKSLACGKNAVGSQVALDAGNMDLHTLHHLDCGAENLID